MPVNTHSASTWLRGNGHAFCVMYIYRMSLFSDLEIKSQAPWPYAIMEYIIFIFSFYVSDELTNLENKIQPADRIMDNCRDMIC